MESNQSLNTLLEKLIFIGKKDAALARLNNERLKIEATFKAQKDDLAKVKSLYAQRKKLADEKKYSYDKEEKALRDEQAKLVERRKALLTFSNYKVQQSAEKEINNAAKELSQKEELALQILEEVEKLNKELTSLKQDIDTKEGACEKAESETHETLINMGAIAKDYQREKEAVSSQVAADVLHNYEKIRQKSPMDPVIPLSGNSCSGCFMSLAPQLIVNIKKGDSLVRCNGCGRIVFIES